MTSLKFYKCKRFFSIVLGACPCNFIVNLRRSNIDLQLLLTPKERKISGCSRIKIITGVQCNLDYPDSLGPDKTVRISYSPDKRGQLLHSGIGKGLLSMFG